MTAIPCSCPRALPPRAQQFASPRVTGTFASSPGTSVRGRGHCECRSSYRACSAVCSPCLTAARSAATACGRRRRASSCCSATSAASSARGRSPSALPPPAAGPRTRSTTSIWIRGSASSRPVRLSSSVHCGRGALSARRRAASPPRVDEGSRAERGLCLLRRSQAAPRRLAEHDLRGGALPEHRRVLGPRDRQTPGCGGPGTGPFQTRGDTCTRACRYCYVHSGRPEQPPDPLEPLRLAKGAAEMNLKHVVVTSVDRDDVADRGAGHSAATIRALKAKLPQASVEVLTPDFLGVEEEALRTVLAPRPEVFNHNIETVRRLHARMRGAKASYDKALWLLARAKELADYPVLTKSGIMVGLGETNDEVVETLRDLREHGVDVVTIG